MLIPWSWKKGYVVKQGWDILNNGEKITMTSKATFDRFEKKRLPSFGMKTVAIRKENQKRIIGNEISNWEVEIWDVQGLGIYRLKSKSEDKEYLMEYKKEITWSQYQRYFNR